MNEIRKANHKIVILGGGTAGIITASLLRRAGQTDIAVVEPSDRHFYQPLWTLVGAGVVSADSTARSESSYIPRGVRWIQEAVAEIEPGINKVTTRYGMVFRYDFLVVELGAQLFWRSYPSWRSHQQLRFAARFQNLGTHPELPAWHGSLPHAGYTD